MATNIVHKFGSLHEYVAYADGPCDMPDSDRSSRRKSSDFDGTGTFGEAVELALHGWSEVRPQIDRITSQIATQAKEVIHMAFQPVYDIQGAMVDVGAYLSGEPECMVDFLPVEQSRVGRVVTVIVQRGVSSAVSAESIMARGAAIAALVEVLAIAQHSCEIWVEASCQPTDGRKKGSTWTTLVRVKEANERFDIDAMSFALAHPAMHRRITFSAREREDRGTRETFGFGYDTRLGNYGRSLENCLMADEVGATVVVKGTGASATDLDRDPVKWLKGIMNDLGLSENGEEG